MTTCTPIFSSVLIETNTDADGAESRMVYKSKRSRSKFTDIDPAVQTAIDPLNDEEEIELNTGKYIVKISQHLLQIFVSIDFDSKIMHSKGHLQRTKMTLCCFGTARNMRPNMNYLMLRMTIFSKVSANYAIKYFILSFWE